MVEFVSDNILYNIERWLMYYCSELQMRVMVQEIGFVRSKSTKFPKI